MKNTPQRIAVEKIILEMHDHPTADDVYKRVKATMPSISKATVYRILNSLVEENLIKKIQLHGGADRFDTQTDHHCHIKCIKCGKLNNVNTLFIPDKDWITDSLGYTVTDCLMSFEGLCPNCSKTN